MNRLLQLGLLIAITHVSSVPVASTSSSHDMSHYPDNTETIRDAPSMSKWALEQALQAWAKVAAVNSHQGESATTTTASSNDVGSPTPKRGSSPGRARYQEPKYKPKLRATKRPIWHTLMKEHHIPAYSKFFEHVIRIKDYQKPSKGTIFRKLTNTFKDQIETASIDGDAIERIAEAYVSTIPAPAQPNVKHRIQWTQAHKDIVEVEKIRSIVNNYFEGNYPEKIFRKLGYEGRMLLLNGGEEGIRRLDQYKAISESTTAKIRAAKLQKEEKKHLKMVERQGLGVSPIRATPDTHGKGKRKLA